VTELDQLRRAVAREHRLPARAASFLAGTTLDEVEASAHAFAKLLDEGREPEQSRPPSIFEFAAAERDERRRLLVSALCGRPVQPPRNEQGRYARPARGFSGGARQPVPLTPESHEQTLSRVLLTGESDVGASL
jgi:hypothetical protein